MSVYVAYPSVETMWSRLSEECFVYDNNGVTEPVFNFKTCLVWDSNFFHVLLGERKADNSAAWKGWQIKVCDGLQV